MPVFDTPTTLFELVEHSASLFGDLKALVQHHEDGSCTSINYREFRDLVLRFALWSRKNYGLKRGDRVLLCAPNSPEWVVAAIGTTITGATFVPVTTAVSPDQLCDVAGMIRPSLILLSEDRKNEVIKACSNLDMPPTMVSISSLPELLAEATPASPEMVAKWVPPGGEIATILWTSGTNGDLKGVTLTHKNLCSNASMFSKAVPLTTSDRLFSVLPLSHSFELVVGCLAPLLQGAHIVYPDPAEDSLEAFFAVGPSTLVSVPRFLEKLVAWGEARLDGLNPLGLIISGGASLPVKLGHRLEAMSVTVLEGYGLTEAGPVVSVNRRTRNKLGTVGSPLQGVRVRLTLEGELEVYSPSVTPGYIVDTQNEQIMTRDGWLKTGDLASVDSDGYITITGRKREIIVLSTGAKIAPLAIEMALEFCPSIDQAMVIGEGRKHVAALITLREVDFMLHENAPKILQEEVEKALAHLPQNHQVKTYVVISHPFSVEAGELTHTLKLRRDFIEQKYASEIQDLYDRTS